MICDGYFLFTKQLCLWMLEDQKTDEQFGGKKTLEFL
jgi:hypothetical protein